MTTDRDKLFNRVAAAKAIAGDNEELQLAGFMEIFHPRKQGPRSRTEIKRMMGK